MIKTQIWLAPLAGVTDSAYRIICKNWGADILVSEMVSADGLHYSPSKTLPYATFSEMERPFSIQLFGSDPEMMAMGAKTAGNLRPNMIDINMGCPVKKVVKRQAGSALMKDPVLAAEIVKSVKTACSSLEIPLSVKFRAGWDSESINAVEFATKIEEAGADMLILHPRTKSQMFSGYSNWDLIRQVKERVKIPLVGNGDIFSPEDALRMLDATNCDHLMIGRGVMGKPWIFKQVKDYLEKGTYEEPSPKEIFSTIENHIALKIKDRNPDKAIMEMRHHLSSYTKGFHGSAKVRNLINNSTNIEEILTAIKTLIYSAN